MTLDQLFAALPETGAVTVSNALLGRDDIDDFLAANIGQDTFTYLAQNKVRTGPSAPRDVITQDLILPTMAQGSFLNLQGNAGKITYWQTGNTLNFECTIQLDVVPGSPAETWNFAKSYPKLQYTEAFLLPASDQHFSLISAAFGNPSQPAGLYYDGIAALRGPYAAMQFAALLLGESSPEDRRLYGQVIPTGNAVRMRALTRQPDGSVDLILFTATKPQLWFELTTVTRPALNGAYAHDASFGVEMGVNLGSDGIVGLRAYVVTEPYSGRPFVQLCILPREAPIVSLSQIGQLMGGADFEALLTGYCANFIALFEEFGFKSWTVDIGFTLPPYLSCSRLQMATNLSAPYDIVPGYVTLSYLELGWMRINPQAVSGASDSVSLFARLHLPNDVVFEVNILITTGSSLHLNGRLQGSVDTDGLGDWANDLLEGFGLDPLSDDVYDFLNQGLKEFTITLDLMQDASGTQLAVEMKGSTELTGKPLAFSTSLAITYTAGTWSYRVAAMAALGTARFLGEFVSLPGVPAAPNTWSMHLEWEDRINPLEFQSIANSLGFEIPPIPYGLDLGLVAVRFDYSSAENRFLLQAESNSWGDAALFAFQATAGWTFGFTLDVRKQAQVGALINLSNLPLISQELGATATLGIDLKVVVTTADITEAQAAGINAYLPASVQLPSQGFKGRIGFSVRMNFGGYIIPVSMGLAGDAPNLLHSTPANVVEGPVVGPVSQPVQPLAAAASDSMFWVNVQKTFGPVFFERVGLAYADGKIWFGLTARLQASSFVADILGLRVGTPMNTFAPEFDIDGLGLNINTQAFALGGALQNMRPPQGFMFAGMAVARAFGVSLALAGSYGQVVMGRQTATTMFLFGQMSGLALGPAYFMVTGLSGGAGYNSNLRLPTTTTVNSFPFVTNLTAPGATTPTPAAMLQTMVGGTAPWVTPRVGQFWVAAGVTLSSFGFVKLNVMASAGFGQSLELGLIGRATAMFPSTGTALANITLNVLATYRALEGELAIGAVLGSGSYILSSAVRLSGGMAFNMWNAGANAGRYALTFGGYHPSYQKPSYYPTVDRIGMSWSLGSSGSITGKLYLALTPGTVMLGGEIRLDYVSGSFTAWTDASFNALISYAPFAFDVSVSVVMGTRFTVECCYMTGTYSYQVGCSLRIWGPPVGGKAILDVPIIGKVTIPFGATGNGSSAATSAASWSQFAALLPAVGKYAAISAVTGVTGNALSSTGATLGWLVGSDGFSFTVVSAVPLTAASVARTASTSLLKYSRGAVSIRPMRQGGVTSTQLVTVKRYEGSNGVVQDLNTWILSPIAKAMPAALWGSTTVTATTGLTSSSEMVADQLQGFTIAPPAPRWGLRTGAATTANLYHGALGLMRGLPVLATGPAVGLPVYAPMDAVRRIAASVSSQGAQQARQRSIISLNALGFDLGASTSAHPLDIGNGVASYFDGNPMMASSTPIS